MQETSKIDGKGRLLIPSGVRRALGLEEGVEVVIAVEGRQAVISPVFDKKLCEMKVMIGDSPGSLARVADFLSKEGFDIIMSESRALEREKRAEWDILGKYDGDFNALARKLKANVFVSDVIVKEST